MTSANLFLSIFEPHLITIRSCWVFVKLFLQLNIVVFFLLLQHHGSVRLRGSGDRQVCARVLQRHLSHHHVRGAAQRGPHPQALHRHLPGPRDRGAGPGGGHVLQAHLPLPLAGDHDQVDPGENSVTQRLPFSLQKQQRAVLLGWARELLIKNRDDRNCLVKSTNVAAAFLECWKQTTVELFVPAW